WASPCAWPATDPTASAKRPGGPVRPAPRIATIASGVGFVDALARGLLRRYPEPEALAAVTVLLPTRRACRSLREAFLRITEGAPLLLPQLHPVGDLDADELLLSADEGLAGDSLDLPPAIPPILRQLQLARL